MTKVYITIRTQKLGDLEVEDKTERLASEFLPHNEALRRLELIKNEIERLFHDAEFVED